MPADRIVVALLAAVAIVAVNTWLYRSILRASDDEPRLAWRELALIIFTASSAAALITLAEWASGLILPPLPRLGLLYMATIPLSAWIIRRQQRRRRKQ